MPEHSTWYGGRGGLLGRDRSRRCQFSPPTFARQQFGAFSHFVAPPGYESVTQFDGWTTTVIGAGTLVLLDRVGGWLQLLAGGVENQGLQMQSAGEMFLPAANRDIHFGCSIRSNDVTENDIFIGLSTTNATLISAPANDLIGFWTHDGDANLDFQVQSAAGAVAAVDTGVDLVDNTAIELGFSVSGLTSVSTHINGVTDATFAIAAAADIPITELALSFAVLTGEGAANTLEIDWYSIVQNYL